MEPLKYSFVKVLISTSKRFLSFRICALLFQIKTFLPFFFSHVESISGYSILLRNNLVAHAIFQMFQHFTFCLFDAIIEKFQLEDTSNQTDVFLKF